MLEQKIDELISALKDNTAALLGGKSVTTVNTNTTATTTKADKPAGGKAGKADKAAPASKHNRDEVMALAQTYAQGGNGPAAKALIQEIGGASKMADVAESKLDALFDAFTKALAPSESEEEEEEEL